jgi:hypothetical protein
MMQGCGVTGAIRFRQESNALLDWIGANAVLHSFMSCFPSQALYSVSLVAGSMYLALDTNMLLASHSLENTRFCCKKAVYSPA